MLESLNSNFKLAVRVQMKGSSSLAPLELAVLRTFGEAMTDYDRNNKLTADLLSWNFIVDGGDPCQHRVVSTACAEGQLSLRPVQHS